MDVTKNELDLLNAIFDSEYHDGREPVNDPIWVDCACESFGPSAGGIMASLVKKGLAGTDSECCWITSKGVDVLERRRATPSDVSDNRARRRVEARVMVRIARDLLAETYGYVFDFTKEEREQLEQLRHGCNDLWEALAGLR